MAVHSHAHHALMGSAKCLVAPPAGITPASAAEQKHDQKNDQNCFHEEPPKSEEAAELVAAKVVFASLRQHHTKHRQSGYLSTSGHSVNSSVDFLAAPAAITFFLGS